MTPVPGLLTQVVKDWGGLALTTTYLDFDAQGKAKTEIGPDGSSVTRRLYDEWGRVISQTSPAGLTTLYEYDGRDKLVRQVEDYTPDGVSGRNAVTEYIYDAEGNLAGTRSSASGVEVQTANAYDVNGKPALRQDDLGRESLSFYDDADQLVAEIDPVGGVVSYTYDLNGRQATVTDAGGVVTRGSTMAMATWRAPSPTGKTASMTLPSRTPTSRRATSTTWPATP